MIVDVVCLGELLVDFTQAGLSENGMRLFEQNPGGAPANVACGLSNLGLRAAFIGKVGEDMHGRFLRRTLEDKGVDVSGLIQTSEAFTTLAFVEISPAGERTFSFSRKPGADTCLSVGELNLELLKQCGIFHFGSLSLTDEPARSATKKAVSVAKESGALISYDPNYRAPLWHSEQQAVQEMRSVLADVDIIKISEEEILLVAGEPVLQKAKEVLLNKGIRCVIVTLGKKGSVVFTKEQEVYSSVIDVPVVDTTGAGDAFLSGFLYQLVRGGADRLDALRAEELQRYSDFANTVATLCVTKRGAIPAMPTLREVESFQTI